MPETWTSKLTGQDNEGCFTLIKGPINQQDGAILNRYVLNSGSSSIIKKCATGLQTQININQLIGSDFSTPISSNN